MADQIPVTIELEETILRAVRLRGAKEGLSWAEVVNCLLQKALAAEIEEVSGVPPLAAMIQNHHDREHEILRTQNKSGKPGEP
jgi:hypothetical protein